MTVRSLGLMVAVVGLGLSLGACKTTPPPAPAGTALTNADLVALYMNGSATVNTGTSLGSGNRFEISRDGNGSQSGRGIGVDWSDTGSYRIDGNTICSRWKTLRGGREQCSTFYRKADGSYASYDESGMKMADFTVKGS